MVELGHVGVAHSEPPAIRFAAFFRLLAQLAPGRASSYMADLAASDPDLFYRLHLTGETRPAGDPPLEPAAETRVGLEERTRALSDMIDGALGQNYAFAPGMDHAMGSGADVYGIWPEEGVIGSLDSLVGVLERILDGGLGSLVRAHSVVSVVVDVTVPARVTGSGKSDLSALSDALGQLRHYGFVGRFVLRDDPHGKELAVFHARNGLTARGRPAPPRAPQPTTNGASP